MNRNSVLRELFERKHVAFSQISPAECSDLTAQVLEKFTERQKYESLVLNLKRPSIRQKSIEYHKYFKNRVTDFDSKQETGIFRWLSNHGESDCFVFWDTPLWGGMRFETNNLSDNELSFFAEGYICDLQLNKVVAVTLDNDIFEFKH